MTYNIVLSEDAYKDLSDLSDVITYEFKAPLTAFRYMRNLRDKISSLKHFPESYSIQYRTSLQQYGANVRRINYKRMARLFILSTKTLYIYIASYQER